MITKEETSARIAWTYLMTDLSSCEFITTNPLSKLVCYKVYVFTPGGMMRLDSCASDFKAWSYPKKAAIRSIKHYMMRTDKVEIYSPWPLQMIIDNWKQHGLLDSRVLEKKLIEMYDGHTHAQVSHTSETFPYLLRNKLMTNIRRDSAARLSPYPNNFII